MIYTTTSKNGSRRKYHNRKDCPRLKIANEIVSHETQTIKPLNLEPCEYCVESKTYGTWEAGGICPMCGENYSNTLADHLPCQ